LFPGLTFPFGFVALAWAEEVSCQTERVPAVMTYFVAVEAFEVFAVADACDHMLFGACLVVFV